MWTVIFLFGFFALLGSLGGKGDKPTELSAAVWVPDPDERAKRLRAAVAAWREGRRWTPPEKLASWTSPGLPPVADPNATLRELRPFRRHPMRPVEWK